MLDPEKDDRVETVCDAFADLLPIYATHRYDLSTEQQELISDHLTTCEFCRTAVIAQKITEEARPELLEMLELPPPAGRA